MDSSLAVMTRGLTKSYGPVPALRGVDLEVRRGEIFGFLGPNGAGKTTAIRCFLDLIRPSGGTVRVLGLDPQAESLAVRARAGYLPGEFHLDDNLTADAALPIRAADRSAAPGRNALHWMQASRPSGLDTVVRWCYCRASTGNKWRLRAVGFARAYFHSPQ